MKVRWIAAACSLFLLLGVQGLQSERAYANCCPCSCMPWMCTCAGKVDPVQGYCNYCLSPEPILQGTALVDTGTDQPKSEKEFGPAILRLSSSSKQLQQIAEVRITTPCLRDKFFYGVLGDQRVLKFETLHFDEKDKDQTLAFHVSER